MWPLLSRMKPVPLPSGASTTAVWRALHRDRHCALQAASQESMAGQPQLERASPAYEGHVEYVDYAVCVPLKEADDSLLPVCTTTTSFSV